MEKVVVVVSHVLGPVYSDEELIKVLDCFPLVVF